MNNPEASYMWNLNKKKIGSAYEYCCGYIKKDGKPCRAKPAHWSKKDKIKTWGFCRHHNIQFY